MSDASEVVVSTIQSLLKRVKKERDVQLTSGLFADGIGFDSLETAELSAMLEDEFGHDPFSSGEMPETVQDIVDFYEAAASAT